MMSLDNHKIMAELNRQTASGRAIAGPKPVESHRGLLKLSGFDETVKALRNAKTAITLSLARTIAAIGVDVLAHSIKRAPVETGELRHSGTATVKIGRYEYKVGRGTAEGTVRADLAAFMAKDLKKARTLYLDVSYKKVEAGIDIALWLHEELLDYTKRPLSPAAITPGTGPKYLSGPWEERQKLYRAWIADTLSPSVITQNFVLASKITKRRVGKYDVDITSVTPEKIGWRSAWLDR